MSDEPDLYAQIAADYPDSWVLAALRSPSPATARRRRRDGAQAPATNKPAGEPPTAGHGRPGSGNGATVGNYRMIRAYAATLVPGQDGTAKIDPQAALRFASRAGNWSHQDRPLRQQRSHLLGAMALLASRGDLDKRDVASYWTWPAGHQGGVDPIVAGRTPGHHTDAEPAPQPTPSPTPTPRQGA